MKKLMQKILKIVLALFNKVRYYNRRRLIKNMAKKKEENEMTKTEELNLTQKLELTHNGIGSFKDETGNWFVVKLKFNPKTKEAIVSDLIDVGSPYRDHMQERFKIEVVKGEII